MRIRGFTLIQLLLGLAAVAIIATAVVYTADQLGSNPTANTNAAVFCTADAKLCPDGVTYVGRQAPNCKFAACPGTNTNAAPANVNATADATEGWKTYTSAQYHFSLRYPSGWTTTEGATTTPYKIDFYPMGGAGWSTTGAISFWVDRPYSQQCPDPQVSTTTSVTYGGKQATLSTVTGDGKPCYRHAIFTTQPTAWGADAEIQMNPDTSGSYDLAEQILGTLVFTDQTAATKLGTYTVEYFVNGKRNDTRLIQIVNGKKQVLVSSTHDAAGLEGDRALIEFTFPAIGTKLYLASAFLGTDSRYGALYSYDVNMKTFTEITDYPSSGWGPVRMNSNKTRLVYVRSGLSGDDKVMYLIDFSTGRISSFVTLTGTETFNGQWGGLLTKFNISWKDDQTVRYTVYDQNSPGRETETDKKVIDTREITVP